MTTLYPFPFSPFRGVDVWEIGTLHPLKGAEKKKGSGSVPNLVCNNEGAALGWVNQGAFCPKTRAFAKYFVIDASFG